MKRADVIQRAADELATLAPQIDAGLHPVAAADQLRAVSELLSESGLGHLAEMVHGLAEKLEAGHMPRPVARQTGRAVEWFRFCLLHQPQR